MNVRFRSPSDASAAPGSKIDQCNSEVRPLLASERCRDFSQDHFERRPHRAGQEVAAAGRAVGQPEHNVDMKAGLAVVADGDVPDRAENLALLIDLDLAVALRGEVEPADGCPLEGADRRQRRRRYSRFIGEAGERGKRLLPGIQMMTCTCACSSAPMRALFMR